MNEKQKSNPKAEMAPVSPSAKAVLDTLTAGLTDIEHYTKFDNSGGAFMPASVECIGVTQLGTLYSVAHYYEQNGDLMRDPEIVFLEDTEGYYYPVSYQQDNLAIYQPVVQFEGGIIVSVKREAQKDIAAFCDTWMFNIKEQQFGDEAE